MLKTFSKDFLWLISNFTVNVNNLFMYLLYRLWTLWKLTKLIFFDVHLFTIVSILFIHVTLSCFREFYRKINNYHIDTQFHSRHNDYMLSPWSGVTHYDYWLGFQLLFLDHYYHLSRQIKLMPDLLFGKWNVYGIYMAWWGINSFHKMNYKNIIIVIIISDIFQYLNFVLDFESN